MPRVCTLCSHEDREEIDAALVLGRPSRELAEQYGLSGSAVRRHRLDHLSAALARVAAARQEAGPSSALDRLEELRQRAMKVLDSADEEGKASLSLAAIREVRSLVELIAKITGELDERAQVAVVNVQTSEEWAQIRAALSQALAPHPDAARAVSARLLALGAA